MRFVGDRQIDAIRMYLLDGKSITPMGALELCGCFRLSAVIYRLKYDEGIPIITEMVQHDADNNRRRYAMYYIDRNFLKKYKEEHPDD